ncbi:MAG: L,D-transpeptidase [Hyphomicrobium sp.]
MKPMISRISTASLAGTLAGLVAAFTAVAVAPSPASAQGWYDWERPLRVRPRPPSYYDEYDGYDGPRAYERHRWYRRYGRGFNPYDDEEGWSEPRRRPAVRPDEREDDFDSNDEADIDNGSRPAGVTGGARPVIAPKAPPIVPFSAAYKQGSIVIDTSARKLYYVRGHLTAYAYSIGVGREGFSWTGTEKVSRIADWPDWYPPAEMRKRKPELPERMLGGLDNPLGAKAIYLGNTLYRIHGTNNPNSIGHAESSGCFRMMNANVMHLASIVSVGTEVTVVRALGRGVVTANVRNGDAPSTEAPSTHRAAPRVRSSPRIQWSEDPDSDPTYTDEELMR